MKIKAKIEYFSNHRGAGKLRVRSTGPGAMTRTIGYPHELSRDEGRRHALAIWWNEWEKKNGVKLVLEERRDDGAVFTVERENISSPMIK